ncbi:hypothetical protein BSKO_02694 [Bryopsis sp. KO-2023]|nr:hypothetical protein BSKO_02694 [Bryopsis sp. KO-2023]
MSVTKLVQRILLVALLSSPVLSEASSRGTYAGGIEGDRVSERVEGPQRKLLGSASIMVDAGHGGSDPGAVANGIEEKDLNLATARLVRKFLERKGYTVSMTRDSDVFVPLSERAAMANREGSDLFVSIHYNSASSAGHGTEVLVYPTVIYGLAGQCASDVLDEVVAATGFRDRGVKPRGDLAVLRETSMAAILVEGGFISSPSDSVKLKDPETIEDIAAAIAAGVDDCL